MSDYECIICLEEAGSRDLELKSSNRMIRLCMSACECNGLVHIKCLKNWISRDESTNKAKCPICRTRGKNFTLLKYETPVPGYQPPTIHRIPILASSTHMNSYQTQPSGPYHCPQSSAPPPPTHTSLPTIQEESGSTAMDEHTIGTRTQRSFNIKHAQENERKLNKQRKQKLALLVFLIIMLVIIWSVLTQNE